MHREHPALTWLSLDLHDNDTARFWAYVVFALRQIQPGVGDTSLAILRSPRPSSPESLLTPLLNDLASLTTEAVLVLEDYHAIEAAVIHQGLTFLLDHLPPHLHLFITTRADPPLPLARLRARGALLELRADDLRFTRREARQFLIEVIGLPLTDDMVAALEARTEGWIVGLQLAALAMRDRDDLASFIGVFSGSHRFVADFLAEEVFLRQTTAVQEFLLRTSILDCMCSSL